MGHTGKLVWVRKDQLAWGFVLSVLVSVQGQALLFSPLTHMQHCKHCKKENQDGATYCSHCGKSLAHASFRLSSSGGSIFQKPTSPGGWLVWFIIGGFALYFWYVGIPLVIIILLFKSKLNAQVKVVSLVMFVTIISIIGVIYRRDPAIVITDPVDGTTVQASTVIISGNVDPKSAQVTMNGLAAQVVDGTFTHEAPLEELVNHFVFSAARGSKVVNASMTVNRQFTPEEQTEYDRRKTEEEARAQAEREARQKVEAERQAREQKEREERKAQERAAQETWERTKAGQICKAHPEWTKGDCEGLADGKIWIGMSLGMLEYRRGKVEHANVSNYGSGNQYQYCWLSYTPSCFYDTDGDGLMDSYN